MKPNNVALVNIGGITNYGSTTIFAGDITPSTNYSFTVRIAKKRGTETEYSKCSRPHARLDAIDQFRTSVLESLRTKYTERIHRYTDGSLYQCGVGIGISGAYLSKSTECSVFAAEAAAIFYAPIARASAPTILILTDSASILSTLQSEQQCHPWIQGTYTCPYSWDSHLYLGPWALWYSRKYGSRPISWYRTPNAKSQSETTEPMSGIKIPRLQGSKDKKRYF